MSPAVRGSSGEGAYSTSSLLADDIFEFQRQIFLANGEDLDVSGTRTDQPLDFLEERFFLVMAQVAKKAEY